jgi:hypothetical protein
MLLCHPPVDRHQAIILTASAIDAARVIIINLHCPPSDEFNENDIVFNLPPYIMANPKHFSRSIVGCLEQNCTYQLYLQILWNSYFSLQGMRVYYFAPECLTYPKR